MLTSLVWYTAPGRRMATELLGPWVWLAFWEDGLAPAPLSFGNVVGDYWVKSPDGS